MGADRSAVATRKLFPIGFVALTTGLSPHVIRVWERRYRAVAPERSGKKRRLYSQADIDRLMLLKRASTRGRRIGSVATLDEATLSRMARGGEAAADSAGLNPEGSEPFEGTAALLEACESAVRRMDGPSLLLALRRSDVQLTRESLLTEVVGPLMNRVGDRWASKSIGIMYEHFASSIVRGFLADLLARFAPDANAPSVVVATPSGQHCELGAMAAGVAAAERGWNVLYLGSDLPIEELAAAAASKRAKAVCLSITCRSLADKTPGDIERLVQRLGSNVHVLIGGRAAAEYQRSVAGPHVHVFASLPDFTSFI